MNTDRSLNLAEPLVYDVDAVWTSLGLRGKTSQGCHQSGRITLPDSSTEAALLLHLHLSSNSHHLMDAMTWKSSGVLLKILQPLVTSLVSHFYFFFLLIFISNISFLMLSIFSVFFCAPVIDFSTLLYLLIKNRLGSPVSAIEQGTGVDLELVPGHGAVPAHWSLEGGVKCRKCTALHVCLCDNKVPFLCFPFFFSSLLFLLSLHLLLSSVCCSVFFYLFIFLLFWIRQCQALNCWKLLLNQTSKSTPKHVFREVL